MVGADVGVSGGLQGAFKKAVEWSGGAPGLDQWLPVYLPFRASWQMAIRSYRRFPRPLFSFRTASFPRYGWRPSLVARCPSAALLWRRLTPGLRSFRVWLRVQTYRFAAGPTGPWLSAVYHARASHRYYGLMRQSDELRPAWALRLALGGLCPHGPFASPSLLFFAILFMHAATSIPLADRVLLMAHPSAMRAFTAPNAARLFQQLLPAGFPGGLVFGTAVFS
jgi:hypothetical protein